MRQATKWFNILTTRVPTDPGILARLGQIYSREEDEAQAFHYHLEAYRYFPVNMEVISWLGAYYSLRRDDPVARRNQERLKGRKAITRGRFIVDQLEQRQVDRLTEAEPWRSLSSASTCPRSWARIEPTCAIEAATGWA